jgi:hypothetical protein
VRTHQLSFGLWFVSNTLAISHLGNAQSFCLVSPQRIWTYPGLVGCHDADRFPIVGDMNLVTTLWWSEKWEDFREKVQDFGEKVQDCGEKVQSIREIVQDIGEQVQSFGKNVQKFGEKAQDLGEKVQDFGDIVRRNSPCTGC